MSQPLQVAPNQSFVATVDGAPAAPVQMGVQVKNSAGGVVIARTAAVTKIASGAYIANLTAPATPGNYVIQWDDGASPLAPTDIAIEPLTVIDLPPGGFDRRLWLGGETGGTPIDEVALNDLEGRIMAGTYMGAMGFGPLASRPAAGASPYRWWWDTVGGAAYVIINGAWTPLAPTQLGYAEAFFDGNQWGTPAGVGFADVTPLATANFTVSGQREVSIEVGCAYTYLDSGGTAAIQVVDDAGDRLAGPWYFLSHAADEVSQNNFRVVHPAGQIPAGSYRAKVQVEVVFGTNAYIVSTMPAIPAYIEVREG